MCFIQKNEESHAKTPSELKKTIGDEIKEIVKAIPKLSKKELEKTLENYDDKREKLNATPGIFMKYGFTTSCTNGANENLNASAEYNRCVWQPTNLANKYNTDRMSVWTN